MPIVSPGQATAVGNALIPPEGPAAVPFVLDFTKAGQYVADVQALMQKGAGYPGLSIMQTVYVDNADNNEPFVINVSATQQNITVPAGVQGYFPIFSPGQGTITFSTTGQVIVSAFLANVPIPPNSWGQSSGGGGGGGIPEAPDDGSTYGRKSDGWIAIQPGFADAPDDGAFYARKLEAWAAFLPFVDAPNNANAYVRKGGAWVLATAGGGIPDAPADGNTYGRNDGAWVQAGGGGGGGGGLNSDTYWDPSHVGTYGWVVDATGKCCSCFVQTGQWLSMLGNKSQDAGKVYFETVFTTVANPGPMVGLADANSNRLAYIGSDAHGVAMNMQGSVFANGGSQSANTAYANGDVCGVAIDFDTGTVSFTRNGVANGSYVMAAFIGATLYPAVASPNTNTTQTARFKAADLQYLPAGYSAWGE